MQTIGFVSKEFSGSVNCSMQYVGDQGNVTSCSLVSDSKCTTDSASTARETQVARIVSL